MEDYDDAVEQMGPRSVKSGGCLIGQKDPTLRVGAGTLVAWDTVGLGH